MREGVLYVGVAAFVGTLLGLEEGGGVGSAGVLQGGGRPFRGFTCSNAWENRGGDLLCHSDM